MAKADGIPVIPVTLRSAVPPAASSPASELSFSSQVRRETVRRLSAQNSGGLGVQTARRRGMLDSGEWAAPASEPLGRKLRSKVQASPSADTDASTTQGQSMMFYRGLFAPPQPK